MLLFDAGEQPEERLLLRIGRFVPELRIKLRPLGLKIDRFADRRQIIGIPALSLPAPSRLSEYRPNRGVRNFQRDGFRPFPILLPVFGQLFQAFMVFQLLACNLREHGLADRIRGSFGIFQVEMVLVHLILQRDFQCIQTWFHGYLLFIPASGVLDVTCLTYFKNNPGCLVSSGRRIIPGNGSLRRLFNLPEQFSLRPADRAGLGSLPL